MPLLQTPLDPDLREDRVFGQITIGRGTYLGTTLFRIFAPQERIRIGRYCSIADNVQISAGGNHRPELPSTWPFENFLLGRPNPTRTYRLLEAQTTIGSDVWIGDGAIIGGGISIGDGAVVGAGCVVFRDVPPYSIVVGNPARVVRTRFQPDEIEQLLRLSWWEWGPELVKSRLEWFYLPIEDFLEQCASAG